MAILIGSKGGVGKSFMIWPPDFSAITDMLQNEKATTTETGNNGGKHKDKKNNVEANSNIISTKNNGH